MRLHYDDTDTLTLDVRLAILEAPFDEAAAVPP